MMGSEMKINQGFCAVKKLVRSFFILGMLASSLGIATQKANAEVIDRIEINQVGDQAEIQLHFITRIQYKRLTTLKNGDVRVYLTLLDIKPDDPRLLWEKKDSPPSDIVPPFTVTYPELDSSLTLSFGKALKTRARAGSDGQSLVISTKAIKSKTKDQAKLPVPVIASALTPPVPVLPVAAAVITGAGTVIAAEPTGFATDLPVEAAQRTPEQIQQEAQQLFVTASDALQSNQMDASIEALNKVLNLPQNLLTQPAQELMGEAREKNGEFAKARAEYELYLKLYPNAADKKQVQARIDSLPKTDAKPAQIAPSEVAQKAAEEKLQISGGISQNYYRGVTHSDTFATDGVNPPSITNFSATDQSMLLTSMDLTARKRTATKDTRLVLRQFSRMNFLPNQPEDYRWNAVYVEQSARDRKYMFRLGRQSGSSGGVPGRFDGVAAGYSLNSTWRVNAAAGKPVEYVRGGDPADPKTFYSGSIDLTRLPDQWSGSAYGVIQYTGGGGYKTGGVRERTALGLESHYFDQQRSYMGQVEFDTIYHKVNLATFQGNWTKESGANYYMALDHRRSPPLALNLLGQFSQSVKTALSKISIQELRENAIALSPFTNMLSVGMSHPYSSKLRLATDFRMSNTAGTGAYTTTSLTTGRGTQLSSPGTGNQYALTMQAIGNNLFFENDLGIASATLSSTSTTKGQSITFNQVQTLKQKWRLDESLLLYNQSSSDGNHQTQIRPSLTLNYRMTDTMNLSAEGGIEQYHTSSANADDKTQRRYFFVGYRWDFR